MRLILVLLSVACLALTPFLAWAQAQPKDPAGYSLRQYAFVLGIALLGGLVSWVAKVRKGDLQAWNLMALVGELCTSAFAGVLVFWLCEWSGAPPLLSAAMVGIAGHMGTRAIAALEVAVQRRWGAAIGTSTAANPGDPQ